MAQASCESMQWESEESVDFDPAYIYRIDLYDPYVGMQKAPHDDAVARLFGVERRSFFEHYADQVIGTVDKMAPSETNWERFTKLSRFIDILCAKRAALLRHKS